MDIKTRQAGDATILDFDGNIDLHTAPAARKAIFAAIERSGARLLLNLTRARYIDSSGIAALVESLKAAREKGRRMLLYGLSATAREVLEVTRLTRFFEVYADEAEALAAAAPPAGQSRSGGQAG